MKNTILPLVLGAALVVPSLANAASYDTLQAEIEGPDGELLATQPGQVAIDEEVYVAPAASNRNQMTQQPRQMSSQPLLVGEVHSGNVTPASARTTPVPITLQEKKEDSRGELIATQPGEFEVDEVRIFRVR